MTGFNNKTSMLAVGMGKPITIIMSDAMQALCICMDADEYIRCGEEIVLENFRS